jgi:hypothetical protein
MVLYANTGGQSIKFYAGGGGLIGTFSNTGLAVTGALSTTNTVTVAPSSGAATIRLNSVAAGTTVNFALNSTDKYTAEYVNSSDFFAIGRSGVAYDLILKSGNVGIGTTSPYQAKLDVKGINGVAQYAATNSDTDQLLIGTVNRGVTPGFTFLPTGSSFIGSIGAGISQSLGIGTYGGSPIIFGTANTERARIDSSGNLLVGTTSTLPMDGAARFSADGSGTNYPAANFRGDSAQWALKIGTVDTTSTRYMIAFCNNTSSSIGGITTNGTIVIYGGTSDYRLKDITGPLTNSGTFIDALKPKIGTWKSDGSKFVGFVAHEFAEVSPSSVTGEKDAVDSDGNPVYQGMQASSAEVIANLVAELQSVRKRLAVLEGN